MGANIEASASAVPHWDSANPTESLQRLRDYAESQAKKAIGWYYDAKGRKALFSTWTRFLTILLTAVGGLVPIASALVYGDAAELTARLQLNHWGYLAVGLAGFFLGLDRFYGGSSGWMRYITTAMTMETLTEEFRFDWVRLEAEAGDQPDTNQIGACLDRLKAFSLAIRAQVERETQAWVGEFQSNMAQLEKRAQEGLDAAREQIRKDVEAHEAAVRTAVVAERPGAIEVVVTSANLKGGYAVELDGKTCRSGITGPTCGIVNVAPGFHELVVVGVAEDGGKRQASKVVQVVGGTSATVEMELG